jgi:phage gp36-like protein
MATIDARAKTQAAYEMARREIDALTSVKPRAALEAQIEVLHRHQCRL